MCHHPWLYNVSSGAQTQILAYKANMLPAGQILQPRSVDFKESSFYWERLPLNWEGSGVGGWERELGWGLRIVFTEGSEGQRTIYLRLQYPNLCPLFRDTDLVSGCSSSPTERLMKRIALRRVHSFVFVMLLNVCWSQLLVSPLVFSSKEMSLTTDTPPFIRWHRKYIAEICLAYL